MKRLSPEQRRLFELMRDRGGGAEALAPRPGLVPLGPEQEHTWRWYAWTNEVGYNYGIPLWLEGPLDVGALERAVQQVVDRHDALRARIVVEDFQPYQRIADAAPVALPLIDLRHVPPERRQAAATERLHRFLDERFEPLGERLWRVALLRLDPMTHVLAMSLDELICDARSRLVLITELAELYAANREGRPARLAPLTQDYAGYLRERRSWLGGREAAALAAACRAEMGGSGPLPLAGDRPWAPERDFGGIRLSYLVPDGLLQRLRVACEQERVTRYAWMLAMFSALLSRYTARTDVVVNTHVLNRVTPASRDLVGAFTAPMLSRCRWTGDPTFRRTGGLRAEGAAGVARGGRRRLAGVHPAHAGGPVPAVRQPGQPGQPAAARRGGPGAAVRVHPPGQVLRRAGPVLLRARGRAGDHDRVPDRTLRRAHHPASARSSGDAAGAGDGQPGAAPLGAARGHRQSGGR
jgi:hypothetical protein